MFTFSTEFMKWLTEIRKIGQYLNRPNFCGDLHQLPRTFFTSRSAPCASLHPWESEYTAHPFSKRLAYSDCSPTVPWPFSWRTWATLVSEVPSTSTILVMLLIWMSLVQRPSKKWSRPTSWVGHFSRLMSFMMTTHHYPSQIINILA